MRTLVQDATALAGRQRGVLSRAQLLELGASYERVRSLERQGWLVAVFRGVYAVGHAELTPEGWWRAGLLAGGPWTALTDVSALQLQTPLPFTPGAVHLTALRQLRPQPGLVVHRTRRLRRADVHRVRGLQTTTVARALLDLADHAAYAEVRALADLPKHLDLAAIEAVLRRNPGRHGARHLQRLLAREERHTASAFERRWWAVMPPLGVPWTEDRNVWVAGHKVDLVYPGLAIAVELDGRAHHERRAQMDRDRQRDVDLQIAGLRPFRVVWERLDPDEAPRTAERFLALAAAQPLRR